MSAILVLNEARRLHRSGGLEKADALYREILTTEPGNADAWHSRGVIAGQMGRHREAVGHFEKAIALCPRHPEMHKNLAVALKASGEIAAAIASARAAITLKPDFAEAHHCFAGLLNATGEIAGAIASYRDSIRFKPDYAEAYSNLGALLTASGDPDAAATACQHAVAIRPRFAAAHSNLGNAYFAQAAWDEAIAAYRTASELAPDFPGAWYNLATAHHAKGDVQSAIPSYQKVIALKPDSPEALANLGHALRTAGRTPEAIAAFRAALDQKPGASEWKHVLSSLTGDHQAVAAPEDYIRNLFDPYAAQFDGHLVNTLGYRVPELMRDTILALQPGRIFDVLDLGCGTGLCGMQFRPISRRLVGVDLSPAMIAKAAGRKIYDELITGNLSVGLESRTGGYDLVLAADLFVYVGDLGIIFRAVAGALQPGGIFLFSLERHDGEGFILNSKIRFAHSLSYIRGLASDEGLAEIRVEEIAVRRSGDQPVPGWLVALQKPT